MNGIPKSVTPVLVTSSPREFVALVHCRTMLDRAAAEERRAAASVRRAEEIHRQAEATLKSARSQASDMRLLAERMDLDRREAKESYGSAIAAMVVAVVAVVIQALIAACL